MTNFQIVDCTREAVECVGSAPSDVIISCQCKNPRTYQYYAEKSKLPELTTMMTPNVSSTIQYTPTPDDYDSEFAEGKTPSSVSTVTSTSTTTVRPTILPNVLQHQATIPTVAGIIGALLVCCVVLVICLCCRNCRRLSDEENPLNRTSMSTMSGSQTNNPQGEHYLMKKGSLSISWDFIKNII